MLTPSMEVTCLPGRFLCADNVDVLRCQIFRFPDVAFLSWRVGPSLTKAFNGRSAMSTDRAECLRVRCSWLLPKPTS